MRPLGMDEIPEPIANLLASRFKGREIPAAYRVLARNPNLLKKFIEFRDEIMLNGRLDPILKEKIALRVSAVNECNPCYRSHKRKLEMLGCPEDGESELENAALRFAEIASMRRGKVGSDALSELSKYFSDEEILEIVLVVSLYMFLNTFNSILVE